MSQAVVIFGNLDFDDVAAMGRFVASLEPGTLVIHGGARGADQLAGRLALARGLPVHVEEALWKTQGRAAGPVRNARMLDLEPDLAAAFYHGAPDRGTASMIALCRRRRVALAEFQFTPRTQEVA